MDLTVTSNSLDNKDQLYDISGTADVILCKALTKATK